MELVAETETLVAELQPLLEPIVHTGDPTAVHVGAGLPTWCSDVRVYLNAASLFTSDPGPQFPLEDPV